MKIDLVTHNDLQQCKQELLAGIQDLQEGWPRALKPG